jgi:hypothetical protein
MSSTTDVLPSEGRKRLKREYWTLKATKKYKKKKKKEKKLLRKKNHLQTDTNSKLAKYVGVNDQNSNSNGQTGRNKDDDNIKSQDDISHKNKSEYSLLEENTYIKQEENIEEQKVQKEVFNKVEVSVPTTGNYKDKEGIKSWLETKKLDKRKTNSKKNSFVFKLYEKGRTIEVLQDNIQDIEKFTKWTKKVLSKRRFQKYHGRNSRVVVTSNYYQPLTENSTEEQTIKANSEIEILAVLSKVSTEPKKSELINQVDINKKMPKTIEAVNPPPMREVVNNMNKSKTPSTQPLLTVEDEKEYTLVARQKEKTTASIFEETSSLYAPLVHYLMTMYW